MAVNIMIQGTMSSAGKSFLVTGLCRLFRNRGYRVAPFKSQNMSSNSYTLPDMKRMSKAQVIQAQAAGIKPDVYMNPIMLKPENDTGSELVVNGISRGIVKAADYYRKKAELIPDIMEAYEALDKTYDIIVIEGAGSPAEINLRENDIVNMGLARLVDAPVLLAGDINPGGVFAQLYGTLGLLDDEDRDRIKGLIINKFRGDISLLKPGIDELEEKCKKSVVGVVPMMKVRIEEEDSLTGNGALLTEDELRGLPDIERQYDIMADTLEGSLDMKMISKIMGL